MGSVAGVSTSGAVVGDDHILLDAHARAAQVLGGLLVVQREVRARLDRQDVTWRERRGEVLAGDDVAVTYVGAKDVASAVRHPASGRCAIDG